MSHHPERTARNVRPVNQPPSKFYHIFPDVTMGCEMLEVPQFSQVLPPLPDTPRGISETPMVRVPARPLATLLRKAPRFARRAT